MRPTPHLALYGALIAAAGMACAVALVLAGVVALAFWSAAAHEVLWLLLAANAMVILGVAAIASDALLLAPVRRSRRPAIDPLPPGLPITVVLTAYNDELAIVPAVRDFIQHPMVRRVVVIDNNSTDRTSELASREGAIVIHETRQGYGHCVFRALHEGLRHMDTPITVLCEGDMTFRAADIDKLAAYCRHADIVNGTRIVEQLRARKTQLTTFMYYGNFFVGKLLELRHLGAGTFTDVGTTYKLCRNSALAKLLPQLNPEVNLEFNAHFMDMTLRHNLSMVECPITFHDRAGVSKGGNASNRRALAVGMRMIAGILFGWDVLMIGRPRPKES